MTLDLFLTTTPKGWKETIGFPDAEFYLLKKYSLKKSNMLEAHQTLKILGVTISSHKILLWFLSISGHFWTTQENQN